MHVSHQGQHHCQVADRLQLAARDGGDAHQSCTLGLRVSKVKVKTVDKKGSFEP